MGSLIIDREKCNRDGICVSECPGKIISIGSEGNFPEPDAEFEERCIKCGHCVAVCPTGALSLDWLSPEMCLALKKGLRVTPEQAAQLLAGRRSIRSFKKKTVSRETLEQLVDIACSAPSAKNMQPWHWVVVQKPEAVRHLAGMVIDWMRMVIESSPELAEEMGFTRVVSAWGEGQERICRSAPHLIIAHADKNWGFAKEDCTLAISLLDLYAASLGLGTCWGGYFYKAVNAHRPLFEALGLPDDHRAFGAVMIGYPKFSYRRIPVRNRPKVAWI